MRSKYKPVEVDGIKYLFYGYKQVSTLAEITRRSEQIIGEYDATKKLFERFSLKEVLKDLFRIGVIGNIDRSRQKMRFSFRGDDEILFEHDIFVHNALRAHLSIFE